MHFYHSIATASLLPRIEKYIAFSRKNFPIYITSIVVTMLKNLRLGYTFNSAVFLFHTAVSAAPTEQIQARRNKRQLGENSSSLSQSITDAVNLDKSIKDAQNDNESDSDDDSDDEDDDKVYTTTTYIYLSPTIVARPRIYFFQGIRMNN